MATSISKLAIIVGTEDRQLRAGLKQSESLISKFGGRVAGIFAGAFSFGAVVASIKSFASQGAALDDMSKRTGASAEALSALGYAARQSGTDIDAVETAIIKLSVTLENAKTGSQSAIDSLAKIGLSAQQLSSLGVEQRFLAIAEGLSQIKDPGDRAAVALEIMGKGAKDLLPLLSEGGAGIAEMTDRARALGLVWSGDTVAAAAKLDDQLSELSDHWGHFKAVLGNTTSETGVVSALNEIAKAFFRAREGLRLYAEAQGQIRQAEAGLALTSGPLPGASAFAQGDSAALRFNFNARVRELQDEFDQRQIRIAIKADWFGNAAEAGSVLEGRAAEAAANTVSWLEHAAAAGSLLEGRSAEAAEAFGNILSAKLSGIGTSLQREIIAPAKNFGSVLFQGVRAGAAFMDQVIDTRLKSLATFDTGLVGALEAGSQEAVIADIETRDPLAQFKQEQQALLLGESQKQTPILTAISNGIAAMIEQLTTVGIAG